MYTGATFYSTFAYHGRSNKSRKMFEKDQFYILQGSRTLTRKMFDTFKYRVISLCKLEIV